MKIFVFVTALFFIQCGRPVQVEDVVLEACDGRQVHIDSVLESKDFTSFLFFSPECPVCIQSVPELVRMDSMHQAMVFVYPGVYYSSAQILKFHKEHGIRSLGLRDTSNVLVELLNAEVMPQAIVTNSHGQVLYSGAIDDRSPALGERRQVITQHYLGAVLDSLSLGASVPFASTTVHGCYIERERD